MNIVIEGDAKACFDAIADNSLAPWTISSLITNIIELSRSFLSCCFCWTRRGANDATPNCVGRVYEGCVGSFCLMNCLVLAKKKKISAHSKECIIRLVKMGRIISGRTNNGLRLALFQA